MDSRRTVLWLLVLGWASAAGAGLNLWEYHGPDPILLEAGQDSGGYFIRISTTSEAQKVIGHRPDFQEWVAKGLLPKGQNYYLAAEELARRAGAAIVYVGPQSWAADTVAALPLNGIWRGLDPLSCLRSFASAAGLQIVVGARGLWVIGSREAVRGTAVVISAYPLERGQAEREPGGRTGDFEKQLLARLPIRTSEEGHPPVWITVGTYWVSGEQDSLLVVTTSGWSRRREWPAGSVGLIDERVFKLRVTGKASAVRFQCLWEKVGIGIPLTEIAEDFDGDGIRDFVFEGSGGDGEPTEPSRVVSGADGSILAQFLTGSLVVEKAAGHPKRIFADYPWNASGDFEGTKGRVLVYSPEKRTYEPERRAAQPSGPSAIEQSSVPLTSESSQVVWSLAREVGGFSGIKVYYFPGERGEPLPVGTDVVRVSEPLMWEGWAVTGDPQGAVDLLAGMAGARTLYSYFSSEYLRNLDRTRGRK